MTITIDKKMLVDYIKKTEGCRGCKFVGKCDDHTIETCTFKRPLARMSDKITVTLINTDSILVNRTAHRELIVSMGLNDFSGMISSAFECESCEYNRECYNDCNITLATKISYKDHVVVKETVTFD